MKIFSFTPFHPEYGIKPQTLESIMSLEHDDVLDIHFSQNDNPYPTPYENVTYQHNKARGVVLEQGYDALLSIEADMVVPPDTIERLIEANADVAYGLYVWRHKPHRWNAYKKLTLWGGESISYDHNGQGLNGNSQIIDVEGLGMGCVLIHKDVLRRLSFRLHDGNPGWIAEEYGEQFKQLGIDPYRPRKKMVCDDWLFAMDATHYGFSQRNNLSVICGHIEGDEILWPDRMAENFIRREAI